MIYSEILNIYFEPTTVSVITRTKNALIFVLYVYWLSRAKQQPLIISLDVRKSHRPDNRIGILRSKYPHYYGARTHQQPNPHSSHSSFHRYKIPRTITSEIVYRKWSKIWLKTPAMAHQSVTLYEEKRDAKTPNERYTFATVHHYYI